MVLVMLLIFAIFFAVVEFSTFTHLISRTELVFAVEMVVYFLACLHARRQLGGMSGDISGYSITVAETAALLAVALL
jgi:cobalamin synthase